MIAEARSSKIARRVELCGSFVAEYTVAKPKHSSSSFLYHNQSNQGVLVQTEFAKPEL